MHEEKTKCHERCPNCGDPNGNPRFKMKRPLLWYRINGKGFIVEWFCKECNWSYEPSYKKSRNKRMKGCFTGLADGDNLFRSSTKGLEKGRLAG